MPRVIRTTPLVGVLLRRLVVRPEWARIGPSVRGPLLTLGMVIVFDLLARQGLPIAYPFPFLMLTVVYAAGVGGLRPGLISALLSVLYAVHFLAEPGTILRYTATNAYTLFALTLVMPATAVLVVWFKEIGQQARGLEVTRDEIVALDRRLSFFTEASAVLASSLDYDIVLHDLARLCVPTLGDWCSIHVVSPEGMVQLVAAAHRDPARDLLVRAVCEYGSKRLPFGDAEDEPGVAEVSEEFLRAQAEDEEHRKLYRALAPRWILRVPMRARDRAAGVLTLGLGAESGRRYTAADLAFAEELAGRAALVVDHALLYRAVQEAERRYKVLFESNPQPMWIFDVDTLAFLAVNEAAMRYYGYSREEFLSMSIIDLRAPEDTPGLVAGLAGSGAHRAEVALAQHQRKDGTVVEMELVSHELELDGRRARLVLATDVSDRARTRAALRRSEEQLRQAQRMDAVGRLAGGVAHDFNNLLTTIRGFSDMLLHTLTPGDARQKDVEQIRKAADRGALLTRQLLAFGQRQALQPRPLDLNEVVDGMEGLMQRLLGADIRLATHLRPGVGQVHMDAGQLEQVLVNLVLNARDAMPAGGALTIETSERQISRSTRGRNLRPGFYVTLAVSDTGGGMDSDTLSHLFEPFFTSKPAGQRAGLGLSIVYGIVKQGGGVIRVASEPGRGTTVKIYLPRVEDADEEESVADAFRGSETVLVVEDEDGVRELLRKTLAEHGHTVLEARHGRDALLVAERYQQSIDLLVTDVVMPEMGGAELAEELRPRRPELKVLYISGYTDTEVVRRGVTRTDAAFLQKPFTTGELMKRVRGLLAGGD